MELYPDLIPNGFDWTRVGQSALLGAIMGLTHGAGWNIMGIPTSEIKIWGDTLVAMERAATTYLTTYAFNKAAGNSTSSFDMAALAGVMLSAGVMESVLTRYGFTETRSHLDAWNANELPVFMKDTVAVLGGGFADAAFAAAFSGEPMNPEVVFAMSMGRLIGRQIGYGVEAMYPAKTSPAAVNTLGVQGSSYHTQTAEELIAHQSGTHRIQAPNLVPPTTTSSLGYARSVPDSVEDTLPNTQTPRAKALMTPAYHNAIQEEVFAAGNPTYQASRARTGASHRQVQERSAAESSQARQRSQSSESVLGYHQSNVAWLSPDVSEYYAWSLGSSPSSNLFAVDPFMIAGETLKQTNMRYQSAASAFKGQATILEELSKRPGGATLAELRQLNANTLQQVEGYLGKGATWNYASRQIPNLDLVMEGMSSTTTLKTDATGRVSSEMLGQLAKRSATSGDYLLSVMDNVGKVTRALPIIDFSSMVFEAGGHYIDGNTWEAGRTMAKWSGSAVGGSVGGWGGATIGGIVGPGTAIIAGIGGAIYLGNQWENVADDWYVETYPRNPSALPITHFDKTYDYNAPMFSAPVPMQSELYKPYSW